MAPEGPGNITILDLVLKDSIVECKVDRFEPNGAINPFFVSWSATGPIQNFVAAGDGVVNVRPPDGAERWIYSARVGRAGDRLVWRDVVHGMGLMLVVVLPTGYVLQSVLENDVEPIPSGFKEFKGRMAFYWRLKGDEENQADVMWRMRHAPGIDVESHCEILREEALIVRKQLEQRPNLQVDPDVGTIVDPQPTDVPTTNARVHIRRQAPPNVPHEVVGGLLMTITHWTFITGIIIGIIGLVLVIAGSTGYTSLSLFGQKIESTNVGIVAIFIGVVMIVLNIRRVLRPIEQMLKH